MDLLIGRSVGKFQNAWIVGLYSHDRTQLVEVEWGLPWKEYNTETKETRLVYKLQPRELIHVAVDNPVEWLGLVRLPKVKSFATKSWKSMPIEDCVCGDIMKIENKFFMFLRTNRFCKLDKKHPHLAIGFDGEFTNFSDGTVAYYGRIAEVEYLSREEKEKKDDAAAT